MTGGRRGQLLRAVFGLVGGAFLIVAFSRTWNQSQGLLFPGWWQLAGAFAAMLVGLASAARAWSSLLERPGQRALAAGFYRSQLGKYVPGAVWQAVGQIGYTARAEVPLGDAGTAYLVAMVTQAAAGATVGVLILILRPEADGWVRLCALGAILTVGLLNRRALAGLLRLARRWLPKRLSVGDIPRQRAILHSYGFSVLTVVAWSGAFALLLSAGSSQVSWPAVVTAQALAWTIGFLALPFPSGLGVRELVLVGVLGTSVVPAALIAASVYHRLVTIVAEVAVIAVSAPGQRGRSPTRSPETAAEPHETERS